MKKRRIAALFMLAPLALLTACGGGDNSIQITANWHKNTGTRDDITGVNEQLEYSVSFVKNTAEGAPFTIEYENGVYTTALTYVTSPTLRYRYRTKLDMDVHFTLNGESSETFHDTVETETYFMTVSNGLKPISSVTTTTSTIPLSQPSTPPDSLEEGMAYKRYSYKTVTEYAEDLSQATVSTEYYIKNDKGETETVPSDPVTVKITANYSFFDPNQVLFAIRGMDMGAALSFNTIDPQVNAEATVRMEEAPTAITYKPAFLTEEINAYQLRISYNKQNSGPSRTVVYAKKSDDASNNVYRNVMLRLEQPILNSYGTLVYNLTKADFSAS